MLSEKEENNIYLQKFHSTNDIDLYENNFLRRTYESIQQNENISKNNQVFKTQDRHEKFQYEKYLKKPKEIDRSDLSFQRCLRRKFIETAKKYIGIPYSKK